MKCPIGYWLKKYYDLCDHEAPFDSDECIGEACQLYVKCTGSSTPVEPPPILNTFVKLEDGIYNVQIEEGGLVKLEESGG